MMNLHRFCLLTAFFTFILIVAGGLVTTTESGDSIPDWPLSWGRLVPPMIGAIRYEYTHRVLAATVGILMFVLAAWLWRREERMWVRRLGWIGLSVVVIQALLGGLRVHLFYPVTTAIVHACLAQAFFCVTIALAVITAPSWSQRRHSADSLRIPAAATTAAVFLQLVLGALLRHTGSGLFAHLLGSVAVMMGVGTLFIRSLRHGREERLPAITLTVLLSLQITLGIAALLLATNRQDAMGMAPIFPDVILVTAHVVVGALMLATSFALTLKVFRTKNADGIFRPTAIPVSGF